MATVAFICKLHGPIFHVGRKYANLITKPAFYYMHLQLLTQISVPLSLNIHYRFTSELGTASYAVYRAVLMIAICQDIRRPELPHLKSRIALLRAPRVSKSGVCIDWLRVSGVPRFACLPCTGCLFLSDSCRSLLPVVRVGVLLSGILWYCEWADRKSQGMVAKWNHDPI